MDTKFFGLFVAMAIETVILLLISLLVFLGILGFFLPIIPGLVLIGAGVGLYTLLLNHKRSRIVHWFHPFVRRFRDLRWVDLPLHHVDRRRRQFETLVDQVLHYAVISFAFDVLLAGVFIAVTACLQTLSLVVPFGSTFQPFIPLIVLFALAEVSAILWFRFGQVMASQLRTSVLLSASLATLISFIPLLGLLLTISIFGALPLLAGRPATSLVFLGVLYLSVLAITFKFGLVILGVLTKKR